MGETADGGSRARRVVVVDDNELTLPGFVSALESSPEITVVAALNHEQALTWRDEWRGVDVVIVDAANEECTGDQFPGVAVVRGVREATPESRPLIIVVTGHYLHDGLRHRMAVADADFFFLRSDVRTAAQLVDVVLHPERQRRGVPAVGDVEERRRLGLGQDADVEPLVGYVGAHDLEQALHPDEPARDEARSRQWVRHRRAMADAAGVEPVNVTTGDAPRGQAIPSIRQLRRLWAWAARVKRVES